MTEDDDKPIGISALTERIERVIHQELREFGFKGYTLERPISWEANSDPPQLKIVVFIAHAAIEKYPEIQYANIGLKYERSDGKESTYSTVAEIVLRKKEPSDEEYLPYREKLLELGQSILKSAADTFKHL